MATARVKLFPFLWYPKDADKAARFYVSIFPKSKLERVTTMAADSPSGPAGSVKVVEFTLLGQRLQAMTAGPHHPFNDAMSIMVECDGQAEVDRYWKALLKGGGKAVACGWLNDRWGVRWQIVPKRLNDLLASKDRTVARRVAEAMMQMVKLDLKAIEAAAKG